MKRTKEEAAATRRQILAAALDLFSDKGYAATTLGEIAEAAGVTRGAIYHHFDNKAALYQTLLEGFSGEFGQQVMEAIAEGGAFLEICRRVMVRPLHYLGEHPRFAAFYELAQFRTANLPELEAVHRQQIGQAAGMLESIAGYFAMGIDQGVVRPDLDPLELARSFVALQNGLIQMWLMGSRSFNLTETARTAADLFASGISSESAKQ